MVWRFKPRLSSIHAMPSSGFWFGLVWFDCVFLRIRVYCVCTVQTDEWTNESILCLIFKPNSLTNKIQYIPFRPNRNYVHSIHLAPRRTRLLLSLYLFVNMKIVLLNGTSSFTAFEIKWKYTITYRKWQSRLSQTRITNYTSTSFHTHARSRTHSHTHLLEIYYIKLE